MKGHTHKSGRLPFSRDLPVMISVVASADKLAQAIDQIGEPETILADG